MRHLFALLTALLLITSTSCKKEEEGNRATIERKGHSLYMGKMTNLTHAKLKFRGGGFQKLYTLYLYDEKAAPRDYNGAESPLEEAGDVIVIAIAVINSTEIPIDKPWNYVAYNSMLYKNYELETGLSDSYLELKNMEVTFENIFEKHLELTFTAIDRNGNSFSGIYQGPYEE